MTGGGTIDEPIGRHRSDRLRMAIRRIGPAGGHALPGAGALPGPHLPSASNWRPAGPTKFACICRTSSTRSSAIRSMAAASRCRAARRGSAHRYAARLQAPGAACRHLGVRSPAHRQAADAAKSGAGGLCAAARGAARGCSRGVLRNEARVNIDWLTPHWPAPAAVRALSTLRSGGVSVAPYASFNLGAHVGDEPAAVARESPSAAGRGRAAGGAGLARAGARRARASIWMPRPMGRSGRRPAWALPTRP